MSIEALTAQNIGANGGIGSAFAKAIDMEAI